MKTLKLPEDWKVASLNEVAKIYDGTHQTPKYCESGVPFYSVEHITSNNFEKTKYISEKVFAKENERVKLEQGDILMTRIGDVGTARYVDWPVRASFYVSLALIKKGSDIDGPYLTQFINGNFFQNELWKRMIHVAFPKKINLGEIGKCPVVLPPKIEQQKIANILSTVDEKIEVIDQQIIEAKELKKGLMQRLLTKGIGHTEFKDSPLGRIPNGWEVLPLKKISEFRNGKGHERSINECGDYIVVNSKFISTDGQVIKRTSENLSPLKKGDITMVMSDVPNGKAFSKCHLIEKDDLYTLNQRICLIRVKSLINDYFLLNVINRNKYYLAFDNGVGQTNLKKDEVLNCPIALPPIEEQLKITDILKTVDEKLKILNEKYTQAQDLKVGLMQQLLTGQLRVNNLIEV